MEISQAKIILQTAISSPNTMQGTVPALQLALDLLNNTFKANFVSLETAQKEANDLAVAKNVAEQAKADAETKVISLTASITDKDSKIAELQKSVDDSAVVITDLQTKLATPVEPAPDPAVSVDPNQTEPLQDKITS